MKRVIDFASRTWRHFMHDSLRRNSLLLIASQAVNAGAAFLFWIVCARLFATETVGHATAFISLGALIATFTTLGLPNTVVRFLPTSRTKAGLFNASLLLVGITSLIGGAIGYSLIHILAPELSFVASSALLGTLLISLIVGNALSALLDGTLMSFRKGHYILLRAAIVNIPRLVLPFFVVHAGLQGIVGTYVIMLALGAIYNIIVIVRLLRGAAFKPRLDELRGHTSFAASNYFGGMLGILPSTVLPILVLNNIGAAQAAYFYMPMQLAAFLGIICNATATALFSEASQQDNGKPTVHLAKAIRHMYQLLIPAAIGLALAGWGLLHLYGPAYVSNGYLPLLLLCAASLFIGINWIGDTWLNIQKRSFAYFAMNAVNAILVVGTAFITVRHGLLALAWGWLAAQAASAAIYLVLFARPQVRRFMTRS